MAPCTGQPQAQPAGEIRALVPVGHILRGTAPAITGKIGDTLYWQDTVRTERGGRIRIGLLDGSILNVGSQSSLTITRHDPAAQQTELELTYGRVRARAVHITQPGGTFKVRTPVAVTGVVGTGFDITTTGGNTVVLCRENTVRVRNVEERIAGEVILHAGEFTQVRQGMPPAPASPASPEQLRESDDATSVSAGDLDWSRVEISWPPPGCGQEFTLMVRAWSRQTQGGKEIETPVAPELIAGTLFLDGKTVAVDGGRATLADAQGNVSSDGKFLPEGRQLPVPAKIWPPGKIAAGQGWRTSRAVFAGSEFNVLGPVAMNRQVGFTIADRPATLLWTGACGAGFLMPAVPGGIHQVALSIGGKVVARGQMNVIEISYDVPVPPTVVPGKTIRFGIELRGLAGLDQFVHGHPLVVTIITNNTPAILGAFRSRTAGAHGKNKAITYRVGAGNVDASGLARLEATGAGRHPGEFHLSIDNKLDESLERADNPLTPAPRP